MVEKYLQLFQQRLKNVYVDQISLFAWPFRECASKHNGFEHIERLEPAKCSWEVCIEDFYVRLDPIVYFNIFWFNYFIRLGVGVFIGEENFLDAVDGFKRCAQLIDDLHGGNLFFIDLIDDLPQLVESS